MAQPLTHLLAEVQPDAGGLPLRPAVVAGEALLKDPGQVLGADADAVVGNDHRVSIAVDPDGAALRCVLQGVGEHLLHHKAQPLAIRQHGLTRLPEIQGDFFQYEHLGQLPHCAPKDFVQIAVLEEVIRGGAVQPQVGQNHLHILLDLQELHLQRGTVRPFLEQKAQGGDGGLDLVGPEGVIVRHVPQAVLVLHGQPGPVLAEGLDQRLVVLLQKPHGRRQGQNLLPGLPQQQPQLPVPGEKAAVPHGEEGQSQGQTQHPGVGHGLRRQIVEGEHRGEDHEKSQQQKQQLVLPPEIRTQQTHGRSSAR